MTMTPDDLEQRLWRRLRPYVDNAIEQQNTATRDLLTTASLLDELAFDIVPSGSAEPLDQLLVRVGLNDLDGFKHFTEVAGVNVGLVTFGELLNVTAHYKPEPGPDDDLGTSPIPIPPEASVICPGCGLDMLTADGCNDQARTYRFGAEPTWEALDVEPPERCVDCAAAQGWHHHWECTTAICEACDTQAFGCDCGQLRWGDE